MHCSHSILNKKRTLLLKLHCTDLDRETHRGSKTHPQSLCQSQNLKPGAPILKPTLLSPRLNISQWWPQAQPVMGPMSQGWVQLWELGAREGFAISFQQGIEGHTEKPRFCGKSRAEVVFQYKCAKPIARPQ